MLATLSRRLASASGDSVAMKAATGPFKVHHHRNCSRGIKRSSKSNLHCIELEVDK